ncbi:hypothetical protein [Aureibacter tunicatorum]|uniref:Uncharacterized protein n=1 Tax=Aureibacter tunicatorum TaxID=866807 RepID=A0AAE4BQ04_9BACT|nr:hypothetical protein [Aureibacter tunicatorum]MDR6237056.1 hypothetical protein [Aureibacter tunicatorum]
MSGKHGIAKTPHYHDSISIPLQRMLSPDYERPISISRPKQGANGQVFFITDNHGEYVLKLDSRPGTLESEHLSSTIYSQMSYSTAKAPQTLLLYTASPEIRSLQLACQQVRSSTATYLCECLENYQGEFVLVMEKMKGRSLDKENPADNKLMLSPKFRELFGELMAYDILTGNMDRFFAGLNTDNFLYDDETGEVSLIDQTVSALGQKQMIRKIAPETAKLPFDELPEEDDWQVTSYGGFGFHRALPMDEYYRYHEMLSKGYSNELASYAMDASRGMLEVFGESLDTLFIGQLGTSRLAIKLLEIFNDTFGEELEDSQSFERGIIRGILNISKLTSHPEAIDRIQNALTKSTEAEGFEVVKNFVRIGNLTGETKKREKTEKLLVSSSGPKLKLLKKLKKLKRKK